MASALDIQQQQAHRAEDDAHVCGEVLAKLLTDWLATERAKFEALLPEEQAMCLWVYRTLKRQRCNVDHLSFSPSSYLSVNYWHRAMRIKVRAQKPYILVDEAVTLPDGIDTAPATQTDGSGFIRVFFSAPEELEWLQPWIAATYKRVAEETATAWKEAKMRKNIQATEDAQVRLFL